MRIAPLLLCLWYMAAFGQPVKQYAFTHFTTANGLASNFVNSMVQDGDGYIWLATVNGLQRFDGYRFLTFQAPIKGRGGTLPSDQVLMLHLDKKGNLWMVTSGNQFGIFDTRTFQYKPVPIADVQKKALSSISFLDAPDGTLIVQEAFGPVYQWKEEKNTLVPTTKYNLLPPGWRSRKMVWDKNINQYWIAADSGLALYNPASRQISYRHHNVANHPAIAGLQDALNIMDVFVNAGGNISLITWPPRTSHPYMYHYSQATKKATRYNLIEELQLGYHEINSMVQQLSGRQWVAGRTFLTEWQPDKNKFLPVLNEYRNKQGIRFDVVTAMMEDRENNIWIGTDNGLFLFNPDAQKFNNFFLSRPGDEKVQEGPVHAVLQTGDGNVLVGTWNLGLFNFDKDMNTLPLPKGLQAMQKSLSIWDMHQHTKTKKIWISLQAGGLVVYDPATDRAEKFFPPIFELRTIRQVTEDWEGNLWFGTQSGYVVKWDAQAAAGNPKEGFRKIVKSGLVHDLYFDGRGQLWIATLEQGLLQFDPSKNKVVRTYTAQSREGYDITGNSPTNILQYNDSVLIAVSGALNLINLNTGKVEHVSTVNGLPSNTAYCIEKDSSGVLWIGMANGLCRANLAKKTFAVYDRRDGITYDNFIRNRVFRLQNNRLVFTTDHHFMGFRTTNFTSERETPPVPQFTSIKLSNQTLRVDSLLSLKKISLSYDNTSLAIEFSGLRFLKQKQPVYYYKMEGVDKHWMLAEATNAAIYNHLSPGTYVFKVESRNLEGEFSAAPALLQIEVMPPFWRTWWFYALVALMAIGFLYILDKERIQRLRALQHMRSQIAGNLHEEVNITLNDINLLSEIAKIKADKDIDRSKDYIDQISVKSRGMIEAMDDMLWSIDPDNDSVEKMLLRLKEFTDGFKNTHGTNIELTADKSIQHLNMDMRCRYEFIHFFKEALNYAIQQSACGTLYISLEYVRAKLNLKILAQCSSLEVADSDAVHSRKEMEKRADTLKGSLDVMEDHKSISIILQMGIT